MSLTHSSSSGARPRGPRSSPFNVAGICTLDVGTPAAGAEMDPFVPALGLLCVGMSACESVSAAIAESGGASTIVFGGDDNVWGGVREAWCEVRRVEGSRVEVEFELFMIPGPGAGGVVIMVVGVGVSSEDMVATTGLGCASETASPSALMDDIGLLTPVGCFPESASDAMSFYE